MFSFKWFVFEKVFFLECFTFFFFGKGLLLLFLKFDFLARFFFCRKFFFRKFLFQGFFFFVGFFFF